MQRKKWYWQQICSRKIDTAKNVRKLIKYIKDTILFKINEKKKTKQIRFFFTTNVIKKYFSKRLLKI